MTQNDLAEACRLSAETISAAERDIALTLPTLLSISAALHADVAVIVGQAAPRRSATHGDRVMMRALSAAVHDTAAGILPTAMEGSPALDELRRVTDRAWDLYWQGQYDQVGTIAAPFLRDAAARLHVQADGERAEAWSVLSDAYRVSAYVANLLGARDLAYAAIGHARHAAEKAVDPLRAALVDSGRAWVYLRDSRLADALALAEKAAVDIEPRFSTATPAELTVYGSHINFAAVVASRMGNSDRAGDYLSQSHATGARMGRERGAYGTLHGPVTASAQAVGIKVSLGETGQALALIDSMRDYRDLLISAHQQLDGPIVLIWDNLNVHKAAGLREFAETRDWLTIYYLPPYAPDLNPVEGIWSLLRRGWLSNVAFSTPEHLVQTVRRGLRHIQYRSHLIDGCLTETGLTIRPA
ncbi:transposase [Streptomyces sp. NBC_01197]|uniref:transposase n=1 Tax=Streptomyces sp. NBC_01197 TaxID=2903768 RepID=UPI003FA3C9E0